MNQRTIEIKNKTIKLLTIKYYKLIYKVAFNVHMGYKSISIDVDDLVNICLYKLEIGLATYDITKNTSIVSFIKKLCFNFCHSECSRLASNKHMPLNYARALKYEHQEMFMVDTLQRTQLASEELKEFLKEENWVLNDLEHYVIACVFNDESDHIIADNMNKSVRQVRRYKQSAIDKVSKHLGYN